ncbi:hypothetical protein L1887_37207 [Cichorium endivia]|nr:hypothetical protein L1887_37207 [Cichorium endivia]
MMKAVCLAVLFAFISISSQAISIIQKPQPNPNFKINYTNHQNARTCSFTVEITTSCSSVRYTRDQISISFRDAYDNWIKLFTFSTTIAFNDAAYLTLSPKPSHRNHCHCLTTTAATLL